MIAQLQIVALMVGFGLAVFAANPESRQQYYQEQLASKDSGVYEYEGDLYVHVRQVAGKSENRKRVEMKAVLAAKHLLTRWMIDHVAAEREARERELPIGLKRAMAVMDAINPSWRSSDAQYNLRGQEFNLGIKEGCLVFGQVFPKDAVEKVIPQTYSRAPSERMVRRQLKVMIPLALKGNAQRLYGDCHAWDIGGKVAKLPFEQELEDYLAKTEFAMRLRTSLERQKCPETDSWNALPEEVDERKSENVVCATNVLEKIMYTTNRLERAQNAEEIMSMGRSFGSRVVETRVLSDEEEVVESRTITTVTTRRYLRRRTRLQVCGDPRFEQMFLMTGDGVRANDCLPQTMLGATAVKSFIGGDPYERKFEKIENALRENPYDADLWNMFGRLFYMKDDCLGALNCYRIAVRLNPRHEFALTNLALVYEKLGEQKMALGYSILVMGSIDNAWCTKMAEKILFKGNEEIQK